MCCIKFVQRVVQIQTPGVIADPRVRVSIKRCVADIRANYTYSALSRMKSL